MPNRPCNRFIEVLEKYNEITPVVILSGPTSFAPIIREAIRIVDEQKSVRKRRELVARAGARASVRVASEERLTNFWYSTTF
jgi:hypothetical protein